MFRVAKLTVAVFAMALVFSTVSKDAQAQSYSCSDPSYGSGAGKYSVYSYGCGLTGNQASTVTTSNAILKTAAVQAGRLIAGRIASANEGQSFNMAANGFSASSGLAGGNRDSRTGVWVAGSWSNLEDDNTATAFDGDVFTVMAGVDYKVADRTLLGISVGYEDVDLDTVFNGTATADGEVDGDGYTIAPYISYKLAENARMGLVVGYSDIDYDTLRFDPNTGNSITGSTDADRYFVNASIGGTHSFDEYWRLHGTGTIFYATEEKDAFTETEAVTNRNIQQAEVDAELGQFLVDARLGYAFESVEPYALVGLEFDFAKDEQAVGTGQQKASIDDEDFGAKFGGGLNLNFSPAVSGGVEVYTVEFRDEYEETSVLGNLLFKF